MTNTIELRGPYTALFDAEDYGLIRHYNWVVSKSVKAGVTLYYVRATVADQPIYMHRLVMGADGNHQVDHRDHNGLNNRKHNLRLCTNGQNSAYSRLSCNNTSGYKGVSLDTRINKWQAYITPNRRKQHLGSFTDPWEAAQAYNRAALEQWGEFALLNERIT